MFKLFLSFRTNQRALTACWVLSATLISSPCFGQATGADDNGPRMNRVVELMKTNQPALGIFSWNLSARTAAWVASNKKMDFVVIDLEHSPYDVSRLEAYLLAMVDKRQILQKGNLQPNVVPIVRVPTAGREQLLFVIKQVLDAGPMGILVPHVDSAEDALAAVRACRYPQLKGSAYYEPNGMRGTGYAWPARQWGLTGGEYAQRADLWPLNPKGELLLWLMIETKQAVENIQEIVRVPGIGGLFIGPTDLAFSLGVPLGDPEVEKAMEKVLAACREAKVPCGTFDAQVTKRLRQGFQFLAVGVDDGASGNVQEALKQGDEFRK
jgi:4-hydroxy-2-oxoheptanedioate aldolase